jgi:hypothetical protein
MRNSLFKGAMTRLDSSYDCVLILCWYLASRKHHDNNFYYFEVFETNGREDIHVFGLMMMIDEEDPHIISPRERERERPSSRD